MVNGSAIIIFVAAEADNVKVAKELLTHPSQGLKVIASTNKEIIQGFLASKNKDGQEPSWIGFKLEAGKITPI